MFIFLILTLFVFPKTSYASNLTEFTVTPANVTAGTTTSHSILFKTTKAIANDGKIVITYPAGFDITSVAFDSWTGFDGGQSLATSSQTITITRDGAGTSSAVGAKTIVLNYITNHSTTADNYQVSITTKTSADATLDGPTSSIYFQIFESHTETDIDGIYYFRDDAQTHYQYGGVLGAAAI